MHIGLIGGIGPAATEFYYRALVRQHAAARRPLALTIANAEVRDMSANMAAGRPDTQAAIFARLIDRLRTGGCEAAAITSIGGHFCLEHLKPLASLPLISIIPVLDRWFADNGIARVGVLGSRVAMEARLYGVSSAEIVLPDDLSGVADTYMALALSGSATDAQRRYFEGEADKLHKDKGVDVILLGGTDLALAFDGSDYPWPIADGALIHAEAIGRVAMGQADPADFV